MSIPCTQKSPYILWIGLCLILCIGNRNGLFFCNPVEKKIQKSSKPPLLELTEKTDSLFFCFQFDSAIQYNNQLLSKISPKDTVQILNRMNLHMRMIRSLGNIELSQKVGDTIALYLTARRDTTSQQYAAWLCGVGTNYLSTNSDTAQVLIEKAIRLNLAQPSPNFDELQRCYRNLSTIAYYFREDWGAAKSYQLERKKIASQWKECPPLLLAQIYEDLGRVYQHGSELYETEKYYQQSLDLYNRFAASHKNKAETEFLLGNAQYLLGKYKSAISHFQAASETFERLANQPQLAKSFHWMGNCLRAQGEDDLALEYFQKAYSLQEKSSTSDPYLLNDIALVYQSKKKYLTAIGYIHQILPIYREKQRRYDETDGYLNLGSFYYDAQSYDSAIYYLQKRTHLDTTNETENRQYVIMTYMHGLALLKKEKWAEGERLLQIATQKAPQLSLQKSWQLSEIYAGLSEMYAKQKNWEKSLTLNEKSISALLYQYNDSNYRQNPTLRQWVSPKHLLAALNQKAILLKSYYHHSHRIEDLQHALSTQELSLAFVDSIRLRFQATSSKLSLMGEWAVAYENGIQMALDLYDLTKDPAYIERAFIFAERNKATSLAESLQSLKATQQAGVPDTLIQRANDLQTEIGFLENQLFSRQASQHDSIQTLLADKKEKYQRFLRKMEKSYPSYYKTKYQIDVPNIQDFYQKLSANHQELVEYYMGDSLGYVFFLSENQVRHATFVLDTTLFQEVKLLRQQLADRGFLDKPEIAYENFHRTAHSLYQRILAPIRPFVHEEKLLIIPDGTLGYIPFEILLQKPVTDKKIQYGALPYLLRDFEISYAYSGLIWLAPLDAPKESSQNCIAFAPIFEEKNTQAGSPPPARGEETGINRQDLAPLAETRNEVSIIGNQTGGKVYIENEATESRFKEEAKEYRIIHLATHALINDENPLDLRLVFAAEEGENDGYLYVYELFGMRLNAQLAVLSACNTGYGKIAKGEGVMSLARGFAQAGVPAIVMSLWTAQDKSTSEIMGNFYKALADGKTKDESLKIAKLTYLENASKLGAHPYFWAAFVLVGENKPLEFHTTHYIFYGFIALFIISFLVYFSVIRKNISTNQKIR